MSVDADELRRLSPEQRVKRLKEMEEQHKKDMGEIEALIKRSMDEARTDKLAEKVAPPPRQVDITKLFTEEEKEWKVREQKPQPDESGATKYLADSSYKPLTQQIAQDYSSMKKMLEGYVSPGNLSGDQVQQIGQMEQRLGMASYQTHAQSEKMAIMMSGSREALHRIKKYAGIE